MCVSVCMCVLGKHVLQQYYNSLCYVNSGVNHGALMSQIFKMAWIRLWLLYYSNDVAGENTSRCEFPLWCNYFDFLFRK
jgi:hypothetical protein